MFYSNFLEFSVALETKLLLTDSISSFYDLSMWSYSSNMFLLGGLLAFFVS